MSAAAEHLMDKNNPSYLLSTRQLIVQPKRFRGKINIQRPRAPHYERARVLKFIEPAYFSEKLSKSPEELCKRQVEQVKREKIVNPLQQIIARDILNWFKKSKLIAFFHANPSNAEDKFNFAVALKKINMRYKICGRQTLALALQNTPYEAVLEIYTSHNIIVFGQDENVTKLLKVVRKTPEVVLMAGILDGKFLSKNEFVNYANLGDLTTARARLVQVLQNAGGLNLNRQLTHHQTTLVSRLQQIASPDEPGDDKAE